MLDTKAILHCNLSSFFLASQFLTDSWGIFCMKNIFLNVVILSTFENKSVSYSTEVKKKKKKFCQFLFGKCIFSKLNSYGKG